MAYRYYFRFPEATPASEKFKHGCKFVTRTGHQFSFDPSIETLSKFMELYEDLNSEGRVLFIDDTLSGTKSFVLGMKRKFGGVAFKERYERDGGLLEVIRL